MLLGEWAKNYIENIVRATHPYTPIDPEKILQVLERMNFNYDFGEPIDTINIDTLNGIGQMLHTMTVGALHLSHHEKTGCMHPGLKRINL